MSINEEKKDSGEKKNSDEMIDLANDSLYQLYTSDPVKKKDYTLKITDSHLNKVFGENNFNLNSVYI